jgi:ankyrin repeat protein
MRHLTLLLAFWLLSTSLPATAQTAPTASEARAYAGLLKAAHDGDLAGIRRLAETGADLEQRDGRDRTAALLAAYASNDAALSLLAGLGADMNAQDVQGYDAATIAAVADDPDLMSLALSLGNRPGNLHWTWNGTALIAASHLGHDEVVRRLIAAGSPLDHVNNLGWTALIEAVVLGDGGPRYQETVRALVAAGANRGIADRDGKTPLILAEARGFTEIAAILRGQE